MPFSKEKKILIVDDEPEIREVLKEYLNNLYTIESTEDGVHALEKIRTNNYDLVITDLQMPNMSGEDLLEILKNEHPFLPVIVITGNSDIDTIRNSLLKGAVNFLSKPLLLEELKTEIARALRLKSKTDILIELSQYIKFNMTYKIPSLENYIDPITAKITDIFRLCLPDKIKFLIYLKLILNELLVNAVIHGNKRDETKNVIIELNIDKDELGLKIQDQGNGFDYSKIANPVLEENISNVNGRGLFLVKTYTDELRFSNNGRCVEIVKRFV